MSAGAARAAFRAARGFVVAALVAGAVGCAATRKAVRPDGQLAVATNVPDARVYVDDVFQGRALELRGRALVVPSGTRRVEVRADGWFPAYRDVAVPHAGRATIEVPLQRVPATEPAE